MIILPCKISQKAKSAFLDLTIDTGSNLNLISEDILPDFDFRTDRATIVSILSANGMKEKTEGTLELNLTPFNISQGTWGQPINVRFHVFTNLPVPILLGMESLENCKLDFQNNIITFQNKFTATLFNSETSHSTLLNTALFDYVIDDKDNKDKNNLTSNDCNIESINICQHLDKFHTAKFKKLLNDMITCFIIPKNGMPCFNFGNHEPLRLPLTSSCYTKPKIYPMAKAHLVAFQNQINEWLKQDIIGLQDRICEYETPIIAVPKKDGNLRFVIDARNLNSILQQETILLPKISDVLRTISNYRYYTISDVNSFYMNFLLARESGDLLSFTNPVDKRRFYFKRSPFGVKHVMSNSVNLLNTKLDELLPDRHNYSILYIDDLIIFSNTIEEHIDYFSRVLKAVASSNIKLKAAKTQVAHSKIDIFGYSVSRNGFTISAQRKQALLKIPRPRTRKELIKLLGSCSYFRALLPPSKPLGYFQSKFRPLLTEKKKFEWQSEIFDPIWNEFRESLHNFVSLNRLLDTDQLLIVRSDSSNFNYGGTLSTIRDGQEILLYTMSRAWSPTATRYHITRLEYFGVLMVLNYFKNDL